MKKSTIRYTVERYVYPRVSAEVEVPCRVVGHCAVHRALFWGEGDTPPAKADPSRSNWLVRHIPTGLLVHWDGFSKRAEAVRFAEEVQRELDLSDFSKVDLGRAKDVIWRARYGMEIAR